MINMHSLVRNLITSIHPDESITYYRSTGQSNSYGVITASYADPVTVVAQIQSDSDAALFHSGNSGANSQTRKVYLLADSFTPAGVVRPLARNGDMFKRADNTWWLITAVTDNFSDVGWVSCRAALQVEPPAGVSS